ncbi:MAG: hypothetical protein R6W75_03935 [Smithellaceae bacterium]
MSTISRSIMAYPLKAESQVRKSPAELMNLIGVRFDRLGIDPASLPFACGDTTAGSETELQTVVIGKRADVDLSVMIEQSNYFANTRRRAGTGDLSRRKINDLEKYLQNNPDNVWENSWVRFPLKTLGGFAERMFRADLLADRGNPSNGLRTDADQFLIRHRGEAFVRVPISYLLKLALAEGITSPALNHPLIHQAGMKLMDHFLNDNTSPETSSFYVIAAPAEDSVGAGIALEMSLRYLLTQLLAQYANLKFQLRENGQQALVFLSPHPPIRQKMLSNCVSDAFYRELFMNPCLSGWARGEEKHDYMHLCHQVLSRSQFNAVLKLREAGIITNNLVALPNLSNISLANNGTHVSLGSRKLSCLLSNVASGYTRYDEKNLGDLVVKIVEHFLPLFVGTYTASPYRLDFSDFHPEKALGFLPHELDFTHLRMMWRRWRKKADISIMGNPVTPFGPPAIDKLISKLFRLKGDYVADFRLIDYLVALMSTDQSPALDGSFGNSLLLKRDLADLGVFDTQMSLYLFEKLREYDAMGFSGFEARHYSLFESFKEDMARAVNLQQLLYLLAFKYIATGEIRHETIPDSPLIESERRQVIFGAAIGIPTFFVKRDTSNRFLGSIVARTGKVRSSGRYRGYVRVHNQEYRLALLETLRADAADLIEMTGMKETLCDLEARLRKPAVFAASGKLTREIMQQAGKRSPMAMDAESFNTQAEAYYRTGLRRRHMEEAFDHLRDLVVRMDKVEMQGKEDMRALLRGLFGDEDASSFFNRARLAVLDEQASIQTLEKLIALVIIHAQGKSDVSRKCLQSPQREVA